VYVSLFQRVNYFCFYIKSVRLLIKRTRETLCAVSRSYALTVFLFFIASLIISFDDEFGKASSFTHLIRSLHIIH
jgi:hypothetical protein